jgi:hypothetical protein
LQIPSKKYRKLTMKGIVLWLLVGAVLAETRQLRSTKGGGRELKQSMGNRKRGDPQEKGGGGTRQPGEKGGGKNKTGKDKNKGGGKDKSKDEDVDPKGPVTLPEWLLRPCEFLERQFNNTIECTLDVLVPLLTEGQIQYGIELVEPYCDDGVGQEKVCFLAGFAGGKCI